MLSSFDYDLGFDPFNYVTVLLYVVVLFVLYILTAYCCNFDFNFYYPRINKDQIDVNYLKYFKHVIIKYNLWCTAGEN